ncbi:MAG TPA: MYG1 family protein [Baekduia sp.]|nr:MYG1 family protein [Baekduia sp.]
MRVATHPGNFHADDAFAVATLRLAHGDTVEVVRTRDEAVQAAAEVRVDVGGRSDPETGDFDHHQKGGAGERANGIRYASFGLVWRALGVQVAGSEAAAAAIDERLVQGVDANDTGQTIAETLVADIRPMSVSGIIAGLNPSWDEELTPAQEDERFEEAVALATRILEREVAGAAAYDRARQLVLDAIARAEDPRVIELDRNMPWREAVLAGAPEALYVIYPKSDGWGLQAVPTAPGSFENRRSLPAEWGGLRSNELAAATGVDDAVFAHVAGFYASAGSRDGITALARLAMAHG